MPATAAGLFFGKHNNGLFRDNTVRSQSPFFVTSRSIFPAANSHSIQTGVVEGQTSLKSGQGDIVVQRQKQPDATVVKDVPSNPKRSSKKSEGKPARIGRCNLDPEFPDFRCLAYALKLDIDDNLWSNAHHFFLAASLFPGDNDLMLDTFLRYGLGANLLKTSFGFLGVRKTFGSVLTYGTGIGLKSYGFLKTGKLELDLPIHLGGKINLDLKLDLDADPNDLTRVRRVNTGVGISGHF